MRPRHPLLLAAAMLAAAALGCAQAGTPAPSAAERATGLAQTAEFVLTSTAAATITPATPTPVPTTTPEATATPTPTTEPAPLPESPTPEVSPTPCENDSAFVADVTVPDGSHFAPGAAFTKTWRLRNDGVCTWTGSYTFRHVGGEPMSGASISLPHEVPSGATVELSVALVAPASNGTFTGQWQLHSPDGAPFGTKPFVQIVVP